MSLTIAACAALRHGTATRAPRRFLVALTFLAAALPQGGLRAITVTEILYHPPAAWEAAAGGASLEWIELYNEAPTVLNLSGYVLSGGVTFTFPHDTYLEGRSYLVLCGDEAAVRARYGITNTIGNFIGRLDNGGEDLVLNIFGGGAEVKVKYSDRDPWPAAADGTGHSVVLRYSYADPDESENWTCSPAMGGTPGTAEPSDTGGVTETVLVGASETWRYLKGNVSFPAGWQARTFNDSAWPTGPTGIGYGDGDDLTELADMANGYLAFLARKSFNLTAAQVAALERVFIEVSFDDGFTVYVNGVEVGRVNMPAGDPTDQTAATATVGDAPVEPDSVIDLPQGLLTAGANVIAVSVHNAALTSSDASFVPRLVNQVTINPGSSGGSVPVVFNECLSRAPSGRWLELHNASDATVDLSGYHLSDDPASLGKYTFPAASVIAARGYLTVSDVESGLNFAGVELPFYLTLPDLSQVIAAQVFENPADHSPPLDGYSDARFPDGIGSLSVSTTPTPGAPNQVSLESDIVIHEILFSPPLGRESQEFIELYNRGAATVDLGGFRLDKGIDYTFPAGTLLASGAFVVVAADPAVLEAAHGIAGVFGPYTGTLSGSGERVRLVDPLGNTADEVLYSDGGTWPEWTDGGGSSLELLDPYQDNAVASAWEASDETGKSPWVPVSYAKSYTQQGESELHILMPDSAEILIDQIRIQRGATQFIPNGDFEVNTAGWIIDGNHVQSHRTTEDAASGSASLKIICTGAGDTRVNHVECETSPVMTTGSVTVSCMVRWLRGANLIYFGAFQEPADFQNTVLIPYPAAIGTPGAPNSVQVANLGPVASEVVHAPAVPAVNQSTTVKARVSDSDGVASVLARFRVGAGAFQSATLFDDGAHGDGGSGDGLYAGAIPGQASGTRVSYYIEARDSLGAVRLFPRAAPQRVLTYVHSSPLTGRSFAYRLIHDDLAWSQLNSRPLHSDEMLDATFVFNERDVFYSVGTRFRGSPWNRPGDPRMYRVRFGKDNRYRGLGSINLSRYGTAQNERAAHYSVWRNSTSATVSPMSRMAWARVATNGGTWTMEHVEPINKDYTRLWFPGDSDGIIMKITGKITFTDQGTHRDDLLQWANYSNRGALKGSYRWFFNHKTREIEDDFAPLISLMSTMNAANAVLDTDLERIMDVEQFLRVYAGRCTHDDWDTIAIGNGQNAYIYYAPVEGRWKLLPWDMDHSWGNTGARIYPDADGTMARIVQRPRYQRIYQSILNEMVNGTGGRPGYWSAGEIVAKFLDRNSAVVGADGVAGSGGILAFINARRASLAAQVPAPVAFSITTANGTAVNAATIVIRGRGWVNVDTILVDSELAAPVWTATTTWEVTVPIDVGVNVLSFLAFDREGELVGSASVTVTSTFGWQTPAIRSVAPLEARPGSVVTIEGTELHNGVRVLFGATQSQTVTFDEAVDPDTLTAVVPQVAAGVVLVTVRNVDNRTSPGVSFTVLPPPPVFIRGDANTDSVVDVSDALRILLHLFGSVTLPCLDAADTDNNELLNITDAIRLLAHLFQGGGPLPAPFPLTGRELDTEGPLGCDDAL